MEQQHQDENESTTTSNEFEDESQIDLGEWIAIAVCCVVFLAACVLLILFVVRKKSGSSDKYTLRHQEAMKGDFAKNVSV